MLDWARAGARLRAKLRRETATEGDTPPAPEAGGPERCIAVAVDGLAGGELERVLDTVLAIGARRGVRIVVVTADGDLAPFHARGLPVERVCDPARRRFGDLPVQLRLEQQCAAILRLWGPVGLVRFATPGRAGWTGVLDAAIRAARRPASRTAGGAGEGDPELRR